MKENPPNCTVLFLQTPATHLLIAYRSKHCCTFKPLSDLYKYDTLRHGHRSCANLLPKPDQTMQRQAGLQGALLPDGRCFDMWHDYMNLGGLLERLCERRQGPRGGAQGPEGEAAAAGAAAGAAAEAAPWGRIRARRRKSSAETSSASSPSDAGCGGTPSDHCRFCKQNGESARVYRSHRLKADDGAVVCPILWNYTCPICEATGDRAHTRRYCPQAKRGDAARGPRSP